MLREGWRDRGKLPHLDLPGLTQFITFRLADSLPREIVLRYRRSAEEAGRGLDAELDLGLGHCYLGERTSAEAMVRSILASEGKLCKLFAWTVMSNHVHIVARPNNWVDLGALVKCWKGPAALEINRLHNRSGRLWAREYYDRFVRDAEHFERIVRYVEWNPVKAGLCDSPEEWAFGSAYHGFAD